MENKKYLFKILFFVCLFHVLCIAFCLTAKKQQKVKKNIAVHTLFFKTPSPITPKTSPIKSKKKPAVKKPYTASKKKPQKSATKNFLSDLQKSLQSLEEKQVSKKEKSSIFVPKKITNLKIQCETFEGKLDNYEEKLISKLQNSLQLPEIGSVKISLEINAKGELSTLKILESESTINTDYLKNQLHCLVYPCFNCDKNSDLVKNFIINFHNK